MNTWRTILVSLALLAAVTRGVDATVAFDAASAATPGTGDLSWTHTPVGTPRAVLVAVTYDLGSDQVASVTYGALSLTEVAESPVTKATGEDATVHHYFGGASIPTGAQTVTVTVSGATNKAAAAVTLTAGGDTSVVDTATISTDSCGTCSATLALGGVTAFAQTVFHSGESSVGGATPFTSWTSRTEFDFGAAVGGVYTYDTIGSTDVTCGVTNGTGTEDLTGHCVAVRESGAAAARRIILGSAGRGR